MCKVAVGLPTDKQYSIGAADDVEKSLPGEPIFADVKLAPGDCIEKTLLEGKNYEVREFDQLVGAKLASITCEPSLRCNGLDESRQSTIAQIVAGSTTTVTLTNQSTLGTLKLCVQNGGVPALSMFMIEVSPFSVAANPGEPTGASPTIREGQCQDVTLKEGIYTVAMSPAGPGFLVDALNCNPIDLCSGFFPTSVKAFVVAGSTTHVSFTVTFSTSRVSRERPLLRPTP